MQKVFPRVQSPCSRLMIEVHVSRVMGLFLTFQFAGSFSAYSWGSNPGNQAQVAGVGRSETAGN